MDNKSVRKRLRDIEHALKEVPAYKVVLDNGEIVNIPDPIAQLGNYGRDYKGQRIVGVVERELELSTDQITRGLENIFCKMFKGEMLSFKEIADRLNSYRS